MQKNTDTDKRNTHIISLCPNRKFITPDKILAAECYKHVCGHVWCVNSDHFNGDSGDSLVNVDGVTSGVTLVPAGLSQFCKDTLNPVQ